MGIELHDGFNWDLCALLGGKHGANISDPEVGRAGGDLGHRVARAVTASDVDVDALVLPETLLPTGEIHGMLTGRDPVSLQMDLVEGRGGRRAKGDTSDDSNGRAKAKI